MPVGLLELAASAPEFFVFIGESQLVQVAALHRLRLGSLGWHNRLITVLSLGHKHVAPQEVVKVRPLHQKLRHYRVVVILFGYVTIGAAPGFFRPDRVRRTWAERL